MLLSAQQQEDQFDVNLLVYNGQNGFLHKVFCSCFRTHCVCSTIIRIDVYFSIELVLIHVFIPIAIHIHYFVSGHYTFFAHFWPRLLLFLDQLYLIAPARVSILLDLHLMTWFQINLSLDSRPFRLCTCLFHSCFKVIS